MDSNNLNDISKNLSGPLHISFDITNKCNARCLHCFNRSGIELARDELNSTEYVKVINDISEMKPFSLCFCGGEPMLRFDDIIKGTKMLKKAGVVHISIVSNGWYFTEEKAKMLKEVGVDTVQISLDGPNGEIHDYMRGTKGMFNHAIDAINMLNSIRMNLAISFSPTSFNVDYFMEEIEFLEQYKKIQQVRVQPLMPMGKAYSRIKEIFPTETQYRKLVEEINCYNKLNKNFSIQWGDPIDHFRRFESINYEKNFFLEIKSNGAIKISSYLPLEFGNLRKHSLRDYWNAGIGSAWKYKFVQEISGKVNSIGEMTFENTGLPQTFFEQNIAVDMIDDFELLKNREISLNDIVERIGHEGMYC